MRQSRDFKFELKSINDTNGVFEGLCAAYGNVDRGGDKIVPGAFKKTLSESGGRLPLLLNHEDTVGAARVTDSDRGLRVIGTLNLSKQVAQDCYSDLKFFEQHHVPVGMSFQYKTIKASFDNDGVRILTELQLFEASIATIPMNPAAQVDLATLKSYEEEDEFAYARSKFDELRNLIQRYTR